MPKGKCKLKVPFVHNLQDRGELHDALAPSSTDDDDNLRGLLCTQVIQLAANETLCIFISYLTVIPCGWHQPQVI